MNHGADDLGDCLETVRCCFGVIREGEAVGREHVTETISTLYESVNCYYLAARRRSSVEPLHSERSNRFMQQMNKEI